MEEAAAQMPQGRLDDDESSRRSMDSSSSSSSSDAGATPTDLSVCSSSSSSSGSSVSEEEEEEEALQNENVVDISNADPAVDIAVSSSQPISEAVDFTTEDPPEEINSVETENEAELGAPMSSPIQEQDEISNQDEISVEGHIRQDVNMPSTEPIPPEAVTEADDSCDDDYQEGEIAEEAERVDAELAATSFIQEQDEFSHNDEISMDEPIERGISVENLDVDSTRDTDPIQPQAVTEVDSTEYQQEGESLEAESAATSFIQEQHSVENLDFDSMPPTESIQPEEVAEVEYQQEDEFAEEVENVEADLAATNFIQEQDELSHNDEISVDIPLEEGISVENLDVDITPHSDPIQPAANNEADSDEDESSHQGEDEIILERDDEEDDRLVEEISPEFVEEMSHSEEEEEASHMYEEDDEEEDDGDRVEVVDENHEFITGVSQSEDTDERNYNYYMEENEVITEENEGNEVIASDEAAAAPLAIIQEPEEETLVDGSDKSGEEKANTGVANEPSGETLQLNITAVPSETTDENGTEVSADAVSEGEAASEEVSTDGDESSESSRPPPEAMLGRGQPHARETKHTKMRAYECRRRASYEKKLKSSILYWKSFRDLLYKSLEETRRAEGIVRATAHANKVYGDHMMCIFENALEWDGTPILDTKRKKQVMEERAAREKEQTTGASEKSKLQMGEAAYNELAEQRSTLVHTLIESHSDIGERYRESAKTVLNDTLPKFTSLRKELENEIRDIKKLGDFLITEMTKSFADVNSIWDLYYTTAFKALSGGNSSSLKERTGATTTGSAPPMDEPVELNHDLWIVEMQYRISASYLKSCFDKFSVELSKLFSSMKDTESSRRFRLKDLVITFLERQEKLWVSLRSSQSPILNDLADKRMDRASIEHDVQNSIKLRAQSIQRDELIQAKRSPKEENIGLGLKGVDPDEGYFELASPLLSDLLCKARVIETKGTGMMSSWRTTLAVITVDSYLHLFEMPSSSQVTSGTAVEVAFQRLTPAVHVPTVKSLKSNGKSMPTSPSGGGAVAASAATTKPKWFQNLIPFDTFILPNCKITFNKDKTNTTFDITEKILTSGVNTMFGKTTTRKIYLRTVTHEETLLWISSLKKPTAS